MTDLATLVEPLKRELAVPGLFIQTFPETDDAALLASLKDGFAEAQLQGFFTDMTLTDNGTSVDTSADLSAAGGALVVIFTAMRIIRAQMRALTLNERYKAGPVEVETQKSAMLLRDEVSYLRERVRDLIAQARRSARSVYVLDGYTGRLLADSPLGGFYGYEYKA